MQVTDVARAGGLVYNLWGWSCRAAHPTARMETITNCPLLLAAVGKTAGHKRDGLPPERGAVGWLTAVAVRSITAWETWQRPA